MERLFPFGFPFPTALYLTLYVGTLVVHFLFMNYVLAGTLVVAFASLFDRRGEAEHGVSLTGVLRDWLPFALGAAITAGVAPLLFIQILYKTEFYTANLLLLHRWMAIVPVLIVGFYLLYLLKSQTVRTGRSWLRHLVGWGAALCFLFTAYSWVENHLLSLDGAEWAGFYTAQRWNYSNDALVPRLGIWLFGAFPTMALLVGWQLLYTRGADRSEAVVRRDLKRAAGIALGGMVLAMACAVWFYTRLALDARLALSGAVGGPYAWVAGVGVVLQVAAWCGLLISSRRADRAEGFARSAAVTGWLGLASAGCLCELVGVLVLRECLRIEAVDFAALFAAHERIASAGGMGVFLIFLVLNGGLIAGVVVLIRRELR